jgi:leucyl-tRNA synthetase
MLELADLTGGFVSLFLFFVENHGETRYTPSIMKSIMKHYDHKNIEKKWQKEWEKSGMYKTNESHEKPKCYVLDMFPYPSGEGLHVGHPKGYIATDVYSRFKKMNGFNVLHPMGWDAFGLPAEQYAIKNKIHPRVAVEKNVARFKEQLSVIGFNYDWERELSTTDPKFYKWTQWIFLKLLEKGLAYESYEPINWCPSCQTGLANEDLDGDACERCGTVVEKKPMRQWVLRITDYAERLLADIDALEWPESIKESQKNWIGKSEGAIIRFQVLGFSFQVDVFTTRPDTLFGATYLVLSPEHDLMEKLKEKIINWNEVEKYREEVKNKTEIERTSEGKEKTGVRLEGVVAINPANNEEIPVFIADYVLTHYGTGAIMAVPAHDERDFEFAKKYNLPRKEVVRGEAEFSGSGSTLNPDYVYIGEGGIVNSEQFNGLSSEEAKKAITSFVRGKMKTTYKLRDWVFSRQRYWGEPIPVIHCEKCGVVPVPEKDLPVKLPDVEFYEPTGTGESPLANIDAWVNVKCPKCAGPAKRETNTMPQWAGSSWYYLRFIDPKNSEALVDTEKEKYWSPVDMYVGGAEHATRHLIYARFWHKFLYDIGAVNYTEPFMKLHNVGLILAEDGRKMSKRWGNVVNPDTIVEEYGADTLRVYEMFMGPFEQSVAWSTESIIGPRRFLEKVWKIGERINMTIHRASADARESSKTVGFRSPVSGSQHDNTKIETLLHQTIKKVTGDIENFKFNTAISALMILANALEREEEITLILYSYFLILLSPFAPHITEELWHEMGNEDSIYLADWPKYDEGKIKNENVTMAVQVNGKMRGTFDATPDITEEEAVKKALSMPEVQKWVGENAPKKVIFVRGKLVSIVL